jgi:hypothetical protein
MPMNLSNTAWRTCVRCAKRQTLATLAVKPRLVPRLLRGVQTPGMGEPMPLAISGYHVVRKSSALPVGISRIAFETPFFVVRPRPVISEPTGTSIMAAEDPGPSDQARISTSPFLRDAMWGDAARPSAKRPMGPAHRSPQTSVPESFGTSRKLAPFRRCFSDHSQVCHSYGRSAVSFPRLSDAQTGDKNNYSSVDRRAYLSPITQAIASILTSLRFSNGFCREPRILN